MLLELTSEEAKFLDQVLERHLTGLIRKISHPDSYEFKKGLKSEVDFLNTLKGRLQGEGLSAHHGASGREETLNRH